ncbi:MFS transporter [Streptomyces sp. NPDC048057]|uniref:MFS transporter n=1 Tax=Streptomyces sp. NPDC048057 TaxID=3155628 RepID=UPI0033DF5808
MAVLVLPTLLLSIDLTVLHLALPHLAADLGPSSVQQLWILDVYGFMVAGFLVTMGTLGDRVGRRKLLLIGAACFGAASVLAAYSTGPGMLIATRAVLGVAGATLMPSTLSLIRNMFPHDGQRRTAVAVWTAALMGGVALGPVVGGLLLQWFWWGSVFLIGAPIMLLLLVTAPLLLPEYRDPGAGRLDPVSVLLSLATLLPAVYALKSIATHGWGPVPVGALVAAAVFGRFFVLRQRGLRSPLVDLRLFRHRAFTVGLGSLLLGALCLSAFMLLFAQYLQLVQGFGPTRSGLWMMPYALATVVGMLCTPALAARLGDARTTAGGLVTAALGFALLTLVRPDSGLEVGVTSAVLVGVGASPLMVLVTTLVIAEAPPEKSGAASSLSETGQELGAALGIATLGALSTAVYRRMIDGNVPDGTPERVAERARENLPSAAAAAEGLPTRAAEELMASAHDSFTAGLTIVGCVGAAVMLTLALLARLVLRPGTPGGPGGPEPGKRTRRTTPRDIHS